MCAQCEDKSLPCDRVDGTNLDTVVSKGLRQRSEFSSLGVA